MGNTGRKPSVLNARSNNTPIGEWTTSSGNGPGGQRLYAYWRWNGNDWIKGNKQQYEEWQANGSQTVDSDSMVNVSVNAGPLEDGGVDGNTKKWPKDALEAKTDYVFFQFGKFVPPFSSDAQTGTTTRRQGYNASVDKMKVDTNLPTIMLPIPQDLGHETQQAWQGKAFTGLGRSAISAMAGGDFNMIKNKAGDFTGNIKSIQDSLTSGLLNMLPGVGGNLDVSDISGATRGVVLNPNAELLYDGPEMREIGMSFKMVPKNPSEAEDIREIVRTFRKAALPQWGGTEDDGDFGTINDDESQRENFIRVPRLCKFTFMKGSKPHEWVTQFKPCAISNVTVNYTPDGTFATYFDGSPVATELRLNFQETKLIFADEVAAGF